MNELCLILKPSYDNDTYPGGEWIEILNTVKQISMYLKSILNLAGNVINPNSSHLILPVHSAEQTLHLAVMQSQKMD